MLTTSTGAATRPQGGADRPSGEENRIFFPSLEQALETDSAPVIASLEENYSKLQRLAASGPANNRDRARLGCAAYHHTLGLLHELRQAKELISDNPIGSK